MGSKVKTYVFRLQLFQVFFFYYNGFIKQGLQFFLKSTQTCSYTSIKVFNQFVHFGFHKKQVCWNTVCLSSINPKTCTIQISTGLNHSNIFKVMWLVPSLNHNQWKSLQSLSIFMIFMELFFVIWMNKWNWLSKAMPCNITSYHF